VARLGTAATKYRPLPLAIATNQRVCRLRAANVLLAFCDKYGRNGISTAVTLEVSPSDDTEAVK
jgi:hypothetical protein